MKIKEKTKACLSPRHPFHVLSKEAKRYYGAAILLQTQLSESVSPVDHFELLRLFTFGLHLNREDVTEVIRISKNKEKVLDYVLSLLSRREEQLIFLLDLSNVSYNGTNFGDKEWQAIDIYGDLFYIPRNQINMIKRFIRAAVTSDSQECMKIFANMMQMGMECNLESLRYYIPELEYTTVLDAESLIAGQVLELKGRCEIRKPFIVPERCKVYIHYAQMVCSAPIILNGGELEVVESEILYDSGVFDNFFYTERADVHIKDTCFYCGNVCSVLSQKSGKLKMENCEVFESNRSSAVCFEGNQVQIVQSQFHECFCDEKGGALALKSQSGIIRKCKFDRCYARNGGAIAVCSPVRIMECAFHACHALEYGNSIYYEGLAQERVERCHYEDTMEERSQLVQAIFSSEELHNVNEIKCSTYLGVPLQRSVDHSMWMHNATIYLACPMMIKGGLRMEHVRIEAKGLLSGDLLDVSNGRAVTMIDCQFDGGQRNGIINATGTKLTIKDSIFSNSKEGRAIYNSVDFECENSIFNGCESGAVYGTRAIIKNSIFVNCRGKRGAALYLVSNKGLIKRCTFDRCVAETSGGGIMTFGNYQVVDCVFKECKPDNQA